MRRGDRGGHHNRKVDAPSGTALMLADAVKASGPTPSTSMAAPGSTSASPTGSTASLPENGQRGRRA
ncbi:MAG: dihydrodipicolinate reductase C-terminal domain-containing protein [Evtepia sp.]